MPNKYKHGEKAWQIARAKKETTAALIKTLPKRLQAKYRKGLL